MNIPYDTLKQMFANVPRAKGWKVIAFRNLKKGDRYITPESYGRVIHTAAHQTTTPRFIVEMEDQA